MALQLLKISIEGSVDTDVHPDAAKFFYVTNASTSPGNTLSIDAGDFMQDDGTVGADLPQLNAQNSYFTVNVNGVVQMQDLSTYTPGAAGTGSLDIQVPAGGPRIKKNSPIVLEVVNFSPTSTGTFE